MAERSKRNPQIPTPDSSTAASPGRRDHFLQLMFFQASQEDREKLAVQPGKPLTGGYASLRRFLARPGVRYALPSSRATAPVQVDSPATEVMTDLRRVSAVTIGFDAPIDTANQAMIEKRVRALFVVDDDVHHVLGIITATDILGERPLKLAQERGIRRNELVVRDIMTPADQIEVLDLHEIARARVGDIVATLQLAGRQHALAVEVAEGEGAGATTVCGIFSLTQIARQLGIAPGQTHDIARTFAEIESAIAG
ncbi:MAG TPA: CBS domain-containing protein [Burkholderiaceae bacterium]|nr:CBS domain-containing protein [Burkholderiaceae bacterium]